MASFLIANDEDGGMLKVAKAILLLTLSSRGSSCRTCLTPIRIYLGAKVARYLGMIERSLVLTAVLIGRIEFIGFIFAAKSIARYPEMKEETRFVEYYLIGTLTSISMAFFGGLLLKHLLGW